MYIVAHCLSVVDSEVCLPSEMDAERTAITMLPDVLDNHDWGYSVCFSWPANTSNSRFIKAHMLGDWLVHFGAQTQNKDKSDGRIVKCGTLLPCMTRSLGTHMPAATVPLRNHPTRAAVLLIA